MDSWLADFYGFLIENIDLCWSVQKSVRLEAIYHDWEVWLLLCWF